MEYTSKIYLESAAAHIAGTAAVGGAITFAAYNKLLKYHKDIIASTKDPEKKARHKKAYDGLKKDGRLKSTAKGAVVGAGSAVLARGAGATGRIIKKAFK